MPDPWAFGWDLIAAFLNVFAIGFATWVAWRSVRDWREERLDARQSEVAEQALILAFQAQEVFHRIRSISGFLGEGATRKPEPPDEKRQRDNDFVPIERIQKEAHFFRTGCRDQASCRCPFGKEHIRPFNEFLSMQWEIRGAAHALRELQQRTYFPTEEERQEPRAETRKFQRIIWRVGKKDDDSFEERFTNAIAEIEKFAGPLLESRFRPPPHHP